MQVGAESRMGNPYGLHRVVTPQGVLPQPAWKLDVESDVYENELFIQVTCLNIDSASFAQLKEECKQDEEQLKNRILSIVHERGKMHNPVTGSGGMLIGSIQYVGKQFPNQSLRKNEKVASLVSLTLTPLKLEAIHSVNMKTGQIEVTGTAVLFASGLYAVLPPDLPETIALAALDVCGAPAQTARIVKPDDRVLLLGAGGKAGLLSLYHAWQRAGKNGQVIAMESNEAVCYELEQLGLAHHVVQIDATDPVHVYQRVKEITDGSMVDLTINCVNVPYSELSSILATRDRGLVYFFSTAVQFTAASLGAEGLGKDVQMVIGNGYTPGHADLALDTLRSFKPLYDIFLQRYGDDQIK
nr:L-erythro-3,5-diaminohexanoate dehydrogenase [Polycladospora coralii]